jgi:hypothetical protein
MIILVLTAVLVLTAAAGTFALFYAVKHAPEGHEDGFGFHEGLEPKPVLNHAPDDYENEFVFYERIEPKPVDEMATAGDFHAHKAGSGWAA